MIASESGRPRKVAFHDVDSYGPLDLFHHVQIFIKYYFILGT